MSIYEIVFYNEDCFLRCELRPTKQETNWTSRRLWDNYRKPDISPFTTAVRETTFM